MKVNEGGRHEVGRTRRKGVEQVHRGYAGNYVGSWLIPNLAEELGVTDR